MAFQTLALLAVPLVSGAAVVHGRGAAAQLRRAPRSAEVENDEDATILDFSNSTEHEHTLHFTGLGAGGVQPFDSNPKNGTPWYRMKETSSRGTAGHEHFAGLTARGDFEYDVLAAHNVVRQYAGINPLQWSNDLQELATSRVHKLANEGCYIKHSPTKDRWQTNGFFYIGENLYKVINMVPTGVDIVDAWYAEIEDYTYGRVGKACVRQSCAARRSPPCTLGHFTQVMWHESKFVGCARAECPHQDKRTFVAVCNYGEGGNIANALPFWRDQSAKLGLADEPCPMEAPAATPSSYVEHNTTETQQHKSGAAGRESLLTGALPVLGLLLTAMRPLSR